ncbi:MAG: cell division protein ZapA [Halofilum sp. (in: g-proteobacteria)]|nr:cell division protein ZapA [Halofilum sp. (in: g-proteobacteria)]
MSEPVAPVTVRILDREYQIACRDDEREDLQAAAELVHERMRETRSKGKVIGTDRIAVMTALNIAHEMLALRELEGACERVDERARALQDRIEAALAAQT